MVVHFNLKKPFIFINNFYTIDTCFFKLVIELALDSAINYNKAVVMFKYSSIFY
jgi:hypothetical protein